MAGSDPTTEARIASHLVASIFEGGNPAHYSASNPIQLFIVQAIIIIVFCRLLHYLLARLGQPRVIAEVIGGILLGPSGMMRIPMFQEAIFPKVSLPILNTVANIGLLLFLFLVALDLDIRLFTSNWRVALGVGTAGMVVPLGLGWALAWGLYNEFHIHDGDQVSVSFPVYALFVGTALAITAFPVLCRILTELELLGSSVGAIVLAAGIGNDVTGWILLALCIALANNGSGLVVIWSLLACIGWTLFLTFGARPLLRWFLEWEGSLQNGPTQGTVVLIMLVTLSSAWFTSSLGVIGVHPIFGAFLAGLICPHDGGFAVRLTEKMEDLVTALLLPLFFALSGLSADLGFLNDGVAWAYVVAVTGVAFVGKVLGSTLAARYCSLVWRESLTIGILMSCKGVVELIVLNIGLQAGILSTQTFTIFVVMAVITTLTTAPLTRLLFPPWYRLKLERWKRGEIKWDDTPRDGEGPGIKSTEGKIQKLLIYIRLDSLPAIFKLATLIGKADEDTNRLQGRSRNPVATDGQRKPFAVHCLRIFEPTNSTSSAMQSAEEESMSGDAVVGAFTTFARLQSFTASGKSVVADPASFARVLTDHASELSVDFALVPWGEHGTISEVLSPRDRQPRGERFTNGDHLAFIHDTFERAVCATGVVIDREAVCDTLDTTDEPISRVLSATQPGQNSASSASEKIFHIFMPFFGGRDDMAALRLVMQMAQNACVRASVVYFVATADLATRGDRAAEEYLMSSLDSNPIVRFALSDEIFDPATAWDVIRQRLDMARGGCWKSGDNMIVIGRHCYLHPSEPIASSLTGKLQQAVGFVAAQLLKQGTKASLLVVQDGRKVDSLDAQSSSGGLVHRGHGLDGSQSNE